MDEREYIEIREMEPFAGKVKGILTAEEIQSLGQRLIDEPDAGEVMKDVSEALSSLRHPPKGKSQRGFRPVVIYSFSKPDKLIMLIDVVEDPSDLRKALSHPLTRAALAASGRELLRIIWGMFE